ncbi:MAG: pyridoxal phosphate-dependent aminotransferase, partial [Bacteroidetes bacterium]|nr:pyridoxal phosphate-dependent aminotransferase [Bacteroidota bacterium]
VYTNEELERLAEVCRANNIIVLSDEIYSQINFTDAFSPSISAFYPEKTIVFGGLSKVFSAGGYRLGFMVLPKDLQFLYNSYRSLFSETFSAVSSPIQYAAIEAFKMKPDLVQHIKMSSSILKNISHYVFTKLTQIGIECTEPCGAFYMMIGFNKFKQKINTLNINMSEQLSNYILENYQVALLPASDFYFKEEDLFFRLAFVDFDGESILKATQNSTVIDENFIKLNAPNMFKGIQKLTQLIKDLSIK